MDISLIDVKRDTFPEFMDRNALLHETVFNTLLSAGVITAHYPLWEHEPSADWLEIHYREHLAWSVELNLPTPPDLGSLDIKNSTAVNTWLYNHAQHHDLVSQALKL